MKATEFCYWLQGAFEIAKVQTLTNDMIACVRKHLALVKAVNQAGQPPRAIEFCQWLYGGLDFMSPEDRNQTEIVLMKLSDVFLHAIDKMYENPEQLDEIHGENKPFLDYGPGMRC